MAVVLMQSRTENNQYTPIIPSITAETPMMSSTTWYGFPSPLIASDNVLRPSMHLNRRTASPGLSHPRAAKTCRSDGEQRSHHARMNHTCPSMLACAIHCTR